MFLNIQRILKIHLVKTGYMINVLLIKLSNWKRLYLAELINFQMVVVSEGMTCLTASYLIVYIPFQ